MKERSAIVHGARCSRTIVGVSPEQASAGKSSPVVAERRNGCTSWGETSDSCHPSRNPDQRCLPKSGTPRKACATNHRDKCHVESCNDHTPYHTIPNHTVQNRTMVYITTLKKKSAEHQLCVQNQCRQEVDSNCFTVVPLKQG